MSLVEFAVFDYNTLEENKECIKTLRNFYNYILRHNVCPEYNEDILAAREVCDLADEELFATHVIMNKVPGDFNKACSTLFGDYYKIYYAPVEDKLDYLNTIEDSQNQKTKQTFAMAYAAYDIARGDSSSVAADKSQDIFDQRAVSKEECVGLEVTAIIDAGNTIRHFDEVDIKAGIKPLGKLMCKPWNSPDFDDYDLPKGYKHSARPTTYEFLLEQHILDDCFIGMKMEASVFTLDGGVKFLDQVSSVKCSFYTVLPNEMLRKWKVPKWTTRKEQLERSNQAGSEDGDEDGFESD